VDSQEDLLPFVPPKSDKHKNKTADDFVLETCSDVIKDHKDNIVYQRSIAIPDVMVGKAFAT